MKKWIGFLALTVVVSITTDGSARRSHVTPEQRAELAKVQTLYLKVLALTENGRVSPDELRTVVQARLEEIGYTVVTDRKKPHDVEFRVKCEERKRWAGTTRSGGDAELADAPARLWEGPACLFSYRLKGKDLGWYKETRTNFNNADVAAEKAKAPDAGTYALSQLKIKLEVFDFPLLVTTEWGQTGRLASLLNSPDTPKLRKLKILSILSKVKSKEAFPLLVKMIKEGKYAEEAIVALAGTGKLSIPVLIDVFKNPKDSKAQAAAAKGLGLVAAHTGDPSTIPPLLDYLNEALKNMNTTEDIDFPVLTEVVWSIGKLRDETSLKPIEELNEKIWVIHDSSPAMKELRDATWVAVKSIDLDYQIM